jgi:hypothetical protein
MPAPSSSPWRIPLLVLGWLLIALSPAVGIWPGPGGIFVFVAGLILLLRNSAWARRRYVMLKKRYPKLGNACDRVMRRASALRRHALHKARAVQPD